MVTHEWSRAIPPRLPALAVIELRRRELPAGFDPPKGWEDRRVNVLRVMSRAEDAEALADRLRGRAGDDDVVYLVVPTTVDGQTENREATPRAERPAPD